jgi:hypothetical protein
MRFESGDIDWRLSFAAHVDLALPFRKDNLPVKLTWIGIASWRATDATSIMWNRKEDPIYAATDLFAVVADFPLDFR